MPILEKSRTLPSSVHCVREVRVEVPREKLAELRRFYHEVLELLPWPETQQVPGGWGVGPPICGLYLEFRHDPRIDPLRRRFTLVTASLNVIERRLVEHEWPVQRLRGFGIGDPCLLVHDPAGHLIELRQVQAL